MTSASASALLQNLGAQTVPSTKTSFDLAGLSEAAIACVNKMMAGSVPHASIRQFLKNYQFVESGAAALIDESEIAPVETVPSLDDLPIVASLPVDLLRKTVVMKLNGGLGTGMGLDQAKSLLPVKSGRSFLDFIALQTLHLREHSGEGLRFMLLNSFSTSKDTRDYLSKYPSFNGDAFDSEIELLQGKVPKVERTSLRPASAADPEDEWCPPGHGEIYTVLAASGRLEELIAAGYEYVFVSNSDNLGATLDTRLLSYFASRNLDFLMEVCARTEADSKGGHLARDARTGGLLLREAAQCAKKDGDAFQNISRHRFFNTNNIWFNLRALQRCLREHDGVLPLPVICNAKTVCATDPTSTPVLQLENAMGSAISLFASTEAILVPRSRFAPVKSCADLLSLRSDAYIETADFRIELAPERNGVPPVVSLDDKHYKFVSKFERLIARGVPSMLTVQRLKVTGPVEFAAGTVLNGEVAIENYGDEMKETPTGELTGVITL